MSEGVQFGYPDDMSDEEIEQLEADDAIELERQRLLWAAEVKAGLHKRPVSAFNPPEAGQ